MKVLVFSDSHRNNRDMEAVIAKLSDIQHILHLGDHSADAESMAKKFTDRHFEWVSGNCDFSTGPIEKVISLGGRRIFLAHGHNYGVKFSYDRIVYAALEREADACLFGHTHQPAVFYESGVLFLNPGSIALPRGSLSATYGVVELSSSVEGGVVEVRPSGASVF